MPLDLRQRLSEFSYGYGITREVQAYLEMVGFRPVPFLPNLLHEAEIGCDVYFEKPGVALLLQFKLGDELKQFRRSNLSKPAPILDKPFWRFDVDTAEDDGQYDILLKAQNVGAEVYYVAPRFADWDHYAIAFQSNEVLDSSLLMSPSEIDRKLRAQGEPDGSHRIVYDSSRVYVCSEPKRAEETSIEQIASRLEVETKRRDESIAASLGRIFESFSQRREILRMHTEEPLTDDARMLTASLPKQLGRSPQQMARERARRLENIRRRAKTEDDAMFAAVGIETWAAGSQLIAVTTS
ncbi:hypothetical protein [Roseovarius sp.]|uniref:hypothetical protein n=1 Tax=Roseovarius sp. TaxID=1486281 RepID=UPI003B5AFE0F